MARLRLLLGKFPVTSITRGIAGWNISLKLGGITTAQFSGLPDHVDVRVGDLLTLYTEVLSKEQKNDNH